MKCDQNIGVDVRGVELANGSTLFEHGSYRRPVSVFGSHACIMESNACVGSLRSEDSRDAEAQSGESVAQAAGAGALTRYRRRHLESYSLHFGRAGLEIASRLGEGAGHAREVRAQSQPTRVSSSARSSNQPSYGVTGV
ncbi:MAG: hypothetical protein JWN04_4544 [Myxococcaceae bacterium]|nr:hypothetical protein [Myxococcaceae bacterium]